LEIAAQQAARTVIPDRGINPSMQGQFGAIHRGEDDLEIAAQQAARTVIPDRGINPSMQQQFGAIQRGEDDMEIAAQQAARTVIPSFPTGAATRACSSSLVQSNAGKMTWRLRLNRLHALSFATGAATRACSSSLLNSPLQYDSKQNSTVVRYIVCRIRSFSDSGTPAAAFPFSDLEFPAENASTPFESFVLVFACLCFDQSESSEKRRWHSR
jgi:hypothetical protein